MQATSVRPRAAVVIPTFNRAEYLRRTLQTLVEQRSPAGDFEVVVADDGSSDGTYQVYRAFRDQLRIRYHFQEDLGFRAATARNAGARIADAPLLIFLDTGTLAGPDFVQAHLDAHTTGGPGRAVAGYTYGYRPYQHTPDLASLIERMRPAQIVAQHADDPSFHDWRHDWLAEVDFDLARYPVPWVVYWSMNCSVHANDFWAVGGFTESFHRWGVEDMDFGLRLHRNGVRIGFDRSAWTIEEPHVRAVETNLAGLSENLAQWLDMHRDPQVELAWAVFSESEPWPLADAYRQLVTWTTEARPRGVRAELDRALDELPAGPPLHLAVFGCGDDLPDRLADAELFDFDGTLLAGVRRTHDVRHAIGLRTALPVGAVDAVVITSRLAGLWEQWSAHLLVEAGRIGRQVWTPSTGWQNAPDSARSGQRGGWRPGRDAERAG